MNKAPEWTVSKWPFLAVYVLLIVIAFTVVLMAAHPISQSVVLAVVACVVIGSVFGCLPFILEYCAVSKLVEVNAVGSVAEQLDGLKQYADQIAAATSQWALVQEATKGHADKTVTAARDIAERMTEEIQEFNEFQGKLNDTEKAALRLEVEKLRRSEGEWVQVVVRILDHIFALHSAAVRSGNSDLAGQTGNFQNTCRDAARRVGLAPFVAAAGEKFEAPKHRAHGVEKPPTDSVIAETLAPGMTYQGRLIRPALVRLQDSGTPPAPAPEPVVQADDEPVAEPQSAEPAPEPPVAESAPEQPAAKPATAEPGEFSLE